MTRVCVGLVLLIVSAIYGSAGNAQTSKSVSREIVAHLVKPVAIPPTNSTADRLKAPSGFRITVFATDLGEARMMAVADDGAVYLTRRAEGDLLRLRDADGDGRAELREMVARRPGMHGVTVSGSQIYLVTVNDVYVADLTSQGPLGNLRRIIDDLPDGGQHPNRTLAIGPDGMLYISVGSTCNACDETTAEAATLLRAKPDGTARTIFASGLRNTIGFAWHPETKALFGMDHGIDWLGDDEPREELNHLQQGKQYGWPYIYADGRANPADEPPGEISHEQWARMSEAPVLLHTAHSAPMQMVFYGGSQFPAEYRHDAFVALHGSWNRKVPSGYEVVRVRFSEGKPTAIEPFLHGFLVKQGDSYAQLGRPTGLAITRDGALLVSDDENGIIYHVSHSR